jgi:hypothetical protein
MRWTLSPRWAAALPAAYFVSVLLLLMTLSGASRNSEWAHSFVLTYAQPALMMTGWLMPLVDALGLVTKGSFVRLPNEAGFLLVAIVYSGIFYFLAFLVQKAVARSRARESGSEA